MHRPAVQPRMRSGSLQALPPVTLRSRLVPWLVSLTVLTALTVVMFIQRQHLEKTHIALAFLIVVLGGSAAAGRALGVGLSLLAFLLFNFFFLPPYYTFGIANALDWIVLGAFLLTGIIAAQLLNRAQERTAMAHQRAVEVESLAALGVETLNAGRADDALQRVLGVIRSAIGVTCCEILVPQSASTGLLPKARAGSCTDDDGRGADDANAPWSLETWVASKRAVAVERPDGTKWIGGSEDTNQLLWPPSGTEIRTLFVPLLVRERIVGVLRVANKEPFTLDPSREQFLSALSFYAALGVERVALVAEADRAEAFRQADALKSALIAGVSHDLRTPLTTIKALAHALRERGSTEAASIEDEADRLGRLVADLLDLSRLSAGAMPMRPELNAAEDLVGAAMQQVAGAFGGRRIVVTTPGAGGDDRALLFGRFDFVQSLRALVNLLENAHKYSPPTGPIELSIVRSGEQLEFRVADHGDGIADAERERIFEPFYRAPGAPPDVGGAGLGLAIARRLAVEQGGDVRHEVRQGRGSIFTLVLPAADPPHSLLASEGA